MRVIYADSVFCLNTLMDYFLLLGTARLAGIPPRRRRYILCAMLGGGYAVACFLPGGVFLAETPVKVMGGVLLALAAFGGETHLARLTVLLFALSCALAGCVMVLGSVSGGGVPHANGVLYTNISFRVLLVASTAAYLVLTLCFRASAAHYVRGEMLDTALCLNGEVFPFSALYDTGNSLRDPVSGNPVLVLSCDVWKRFFPREVCRALEEAHAPEERLYILREYGLSPCLIAYHSAGTGKGLLPLIRTEWVEIGGKRLEHISAAMLPQKLDVPALWGGTTGKEGNHDTFTSCTQAAGRSGADDPRGDLLHRRQ